MCSMTSCKDYLKEKRHIPHIYINPNIFVIVKESMERSHETTPSMQVTCGYRIGMEEGTAAIFFIPFCVFSYCNKHLLLLEYSVAFKGKKIHTHTCINSQLLRAMSGYVFINTGNWQCG